MTQTEPSQFGYGLIGCGAFGLFCLEQYTGCKAIRPVAVTDSDLRAARRAAERFGVAACGTLEELLNRPDEIGRAAGRERVEISVGAGSLKKKK